MSLVKLEHSQNERFSKWWIFLNFQITENTYYPCISERGWFFLLVTSY